MSALLTYTKFQTAEDAEWMVNLLQSNNIPYTLTHEVNQLDNVYIGNSLDPMFELKIDKEAFNKVAELLRKQAVADVQSNSFEHYFSSFSAGELAEVINNPNDWNAYDYEVAKSLLTEKYQKQPDVQQQVDFLTAYAPETISKEWITVGYIFSLLTVVGLFIGLSITQAKKTLQNGEVVKIYNAATINHGRNMVIIGSITTFIWLIFKFVG